MVALRAANLEPHEFIRGSSQDSKIAALLEKELAVIQAVK